VRLFLSNCTKKIQFYWFVYYGQWHTIRTVFASYLEWSPAEVVRTAIKSDTLISRTDTTRINTNHSQCHNFLLNNKLKIGSIYIFFVGVVYLRGTKHTAKGNFMLCYAKNQYNRTSLSYSSCYHWMEGYPLLNNDILKSYAMLFSNSDVFIALYKLFMMLRKIWLHSNYLTVNQNLKLHLLTDSVLSQ
jgi:hypothetical protein